MKSISTCILFFFFTTLAFGQPSSAITIAGYIKDNFGKPLAGATISIGGRSESTLSDVDGYYKLTLSPISPSSTMLVTAVGYQPVERMWGGEVIQDFILREDRQFIEEVTVSGIGKSENQRQVAEIKRSGFNVSVIDMNAYANQAANINQVLRTAPGVTLREDGGLGSNFSFRINGLDAKLFIDGVPMENFGSSMSLNNIPVNLVDRIEVYKGVVPAFLGSDALGGAVNIITKRRARPFLDLSYSMGSFHTHQSSLVGTFTDPKSKVSVRVNGFYNHSDNNYRMYTMEKYGVVLEETVNNKFVPVTSVRRFNDAYTSAMGQLELGFKDASWADQFFVGMTYSQNHKQNQLGADVNTVYGGAWSESKYIMPTLSYKKNDFVINRLFVDAFTSYSYDTRHVRDTALYNYDWSQHWISNEIGSTPNVPVHTKFTLSNYLARANFNYDFDAERNQSINLNYNYNSNSQQRYDLIKNQNETGLPAYLGRHILGASWQNQWFNKRLSNVVSFKYYRLNATTDVDERKYNNNNELVSGAIVHYQNAWNFYSASFASRYRFGKDAGWKLSFERAYNLPTVLGLFGDGQNVISNWNLKPERSDNINTGVYYNTFIQDNHFVNLDFTGFYRFAEDFINTQIVEQNGGKYYQYYNIPGVRLYGFEAEARYGYKDVLAVSLNGSYDKAIDNHKYTDDTNQEVRLAYGHQLANRPWIYGNSDVTFTQNNWFLKGSRVQLSYLIHYSHWFYLSESHLGSLASKSHIPTQTIHSAVLSYAWSRNKYNISVEGRNLTDERAYDNFRLQKPGRAFYVKFRLSIM